MTGDKELTPHLLSNFLRNFCYCCWFDVFGLTVGYLMPS